MADDPSTKQNEIAQMVEEPLENLESFSIPVTEAQKNFALDAQKKAASNTPDESNAAERIVQQSAQHIQENNARPRGAEDPSRG